MYKAVIFDLDGTLLNTLGGLTNSVNYVLKKNNEPLRSLDEVRFFIGNGVRMLMARSLSAGLEHPGFEEMFADFKKHYLLNVDVDTFPYEGITDMLIKCKENGVRTAVVTNKFHEAANNLINKHFGNLIEVTIGDDAKRARKPAPDAVDLALKSLGIDKDGVLYVGDSGVDYETAKNSNLPCVLCSWGFWDKERLIGFEDANLVDSVTELEKVIFSK